MNPITIVHRIVLCALLTPCAGVAQDPAVQSAKGPADRAPFVFEAGEIELVELVDRCAAYLQRNILFDGGQMALAQGGGAVVRRGRARPAAPAAQGPMGPVVNLEIPVVTDADGCEELLTGVLWSYGFALVPIDEPKGVYEVLSMNGPRSREIVTRAVQRSPAEVLARPTLRLHVTVACATKHINAAIANNALRPFFAQSGGQGAGNLIIGNVGNENSLLLSGPQNMVAAALQLLEAADLPPREPPPPSGEVQQRLQKLEQDNAQLFQRLQALEQYLRRQGSVPGRKPGSAGSTAGKKPDK